VLQLVLAIIDCEKRFLWSGIANDTGLPKGTKPGAEPAHSQRFAASVADIAENADRSLRLSELLGRSGIETWSAHSI
jgi:hypothetical protein